MDGLIMLVLLVIGGVGGWCLYGLVHGGAGEMPPAPPRAVKDPTLYRHVRDWNNR